MQKCPYCGTTDLVKDPARGDTVCGNPACGELLEEHAMVAETSFVQTSSGGVAMSGAQISFTGGNFVRGAFAGQSNQELAVHKGITKLNVIADRLQLSTQIQEAGRRMYQLAVQMNFNCGRPARFIASACLYVVCRRNRSPHLLIDFSDVLQTPVKSLGRVYMRLMQRLVGADPKCPDPLAGGTIEVPIVDPSIFIDRFSRGLKFGSQQRKVKNTAMRLIQFMHRDWICLGRRPNGLCGAALLIAAYYHGFRFSAKEVANVVRMRETTIRLRLTEMRETPMARMTRQDFEKAGPEALQVDERGAPPCLKKRRKMQEIQAAIKDAEEQKAIEDRDRLALFDKSREADRASMPPPSLPLVGTRRRRRMPNEGVASSEDSLGGEVGGSSSSTSGVTRDHGSGSSSSSSSGAASGGASSGASNGALVPADLARAEKYTQREPNEGELQDIVKDIAGQHGIQAILEGDGPDSPGWSEAAARVEGLEAGRPEFDGLPLASRSGCDDAADVASASGSIDPEEQQEETLSDVDDEELDSYLLDEEERKHKSDIWHQVNKDYLEEWYIRGQESRREARRRQQHQTSTSEAADSASDTGSNARSRRSRLPSTGSCTQSAMLALARRGKVSPNRINMEALESLFS